MSDSDIAIIGLAAHLPGAPDAAAFWHNLTQGVESIRELSEEELLEAGVAREQLRQPGYVRAAATLARTFDFDADFFGLSPKEAGIMDPQHRHFLMATWEALEDAGHVPESFDGAIGVFAGCGMGSYFMLNLLSNPDLVRDVGLFLLRHTGNDKDFLATRASYLFNLRGPTINVQTACSTSLVATHLAVQHLLSGECDLALAGGVTIEIPHGRGYQYHEGEVLSPDGHCRAFDHRSQGTVFGSGVGVVALRRLDDALADGDQIYAVVKGTAVNNDGAQKVGYLAPSVDGQAACITEALAVADVDAESISYVECHGTGTPMGDPIEVAALTQAFRTGSDKTGYCRIGSVKTNIGHLDTAAGAASLIKVSLALRNRALPASLNFEQPNPALELDQSPFTVNDHLVDWHREGDGPLRAGVNSLGVGGTNAFAVLEEAPARGALPSSDGWQLLALSARQTGALDAGVARLADHLEAHPEQDLADVAWTLQVGRRSFTERRVVAVRDREDAILQLRARDPRRVFTHTATAGERSIAFMFPGGGVQHPGMAADLYDTEPFFAAQVDIGLQLLQTVHGLDLRALLLERDGGDTAAEQLREMRHQLPLIFIVEYALAQLLLEWGIRPTALVGHSLGENTAACIAGTISFADCLGLVVLRGRLMDRVAGGAIAVPLPQHELTPLLDELGLDLAVVNSPDLTVVSGSVDALALLEARLGTLGVEAIPVPVSTPVHSRLLDPVLEEFRAFLAGISLQPPELPWVSNRTGTWITHEQATDPSYWVDHLRHTVRFSDCITALAQEPGRLLLEVGPGKTLSSLARLHPALKSSQIAVPTMRHPDESVDDNAALLVALGRIWAAGGTLDTARLFPAGPRRRVALPTYAFQTQPYFIAPGSPARDDSAGRFIEREADEARWFWKPIWKSQDREEPPTDTITWLVFLDQAGIGVDVVERFRATGDTVVILRAGDSYQCVSDEEYVIAPELGLVGYESLIRDLVRTGHVPDRIAHLALLATDDRAFRPGSSFFHRNQELGFQSLVLLAQAWASAGLQRSLHISVATMGAQAAPGTSLLRWPEQMTVLGPVLVIPRELAGVTVSTFDLDAVDLAVDIPTRRIRRSRDPSPATRRGQLLDHVHDELRAPPANEVVAIRQDRRYLHDIRRTTLTPQDGHSLRPGGVVLITGGLGGIGLTIAEELTESSQARLALLSRSSLPDRAEWDDLLERLGPLHPTAERITRVRALEARGAEVLLLSGDVTDPAQMRTVLETVRDRFGALHGVVHGAGRVEDALLVTKPQSDMEDVLAPKVYGTILLDELTRDDDLDLFVLFSSTSTVTAPLGQVDYVAANAFLNAFAESRHASGRRDVVALNWGVWADVGMAAEAGVRMVDVPRAVLAESEATHPLFTSRTTDTHGRTRLRSHWPVPLTWILDEHRTAAGEALVPGAAYLELARAALAELGIDRPFEIRDLTFLRPVAAGDGAAAEVETSLIATEEGYRLEVRERVVTGSSTAEDDPAAARVGWRRTGEASLLLYEQPPFAALDLSAAAASCPLRDSGRTRQQDHLRFGPRWDVVERVQRGPDGAIAWLRLDDQFRDDLDEFGLHPALVDLGTGFAMSLIDGYTGDQLWVPVGYRRIRVLGRLPQRIVAHASVGHGSSEANGFASFDVLLCDPSGEVLVAVEGFTIKRLDGPLDVGLGRRALASEVELDPVVGRRQLSSSELVFQHNLSQGIGPAEGKRLFTRVLESRSSPVVYASSLNLAGLRAQSEAMASEQARPATSGGNAVFSRPSLDADYVAPRDDVEQSLVTMWQELLGIDQIGVHDSFFDLGGHSLIAVRLFAQVKRMFSADFPISILFEAPTVEACAALIVAAMPTAADPAADSTIVVPRPRFEHLVPMHPGDGLPATPFFLVAGMFGNVLNLRHLAHQVGSDRPFYGLQARGLYGNRDPHENFEEMAADYLAEVRTVQPHGPYLLGGFSGGGIAALEMARQLHAVGEQVALLVMLDTPIPTNPPLTIRDRIHIHADRLREKGLAYPREWAVNRVQWERERRHRRRHGPSLPTAEGALHSTVIEAAFYRALATYEVRPYAGVITLYRPRLTPLHVFGPDRQINVDRRFVYHDNGWAQFCERVDVTEIPGDHDSMVLEPDVRVLSAHLRHAIDAASFRSAHRPGESVGATPT